MLFLGTRRGRTPSLERQDTIYDGVEGDYLDDHEPGDYINGRPYSSNNGYNETNGPNSASTTTSNRQKRRQLPFTNGTPSRIASRNLQQQNIKNQYNYEPNTTQDTTEIHDQYNQDYINDTGLVLLQGKYMTDRLK